MSGRSVRLRSVPIQSLSELERARLQEVAFYQLQQDCDLSCPITIPKGKAAWAVPSGYREPNVRTAKAASCGLIPHLTVTREGSTSSLAVGQH